MPNMKRLVICCDGTWNDADSEGDFTNVVKLSRVVLPYDTRGGKDVAQIVYYQSGVGTGGDLVQHVVGGGLGMGLSRNVRDAYSFLANNYCDGDEIFLFGFSRGAYTARSIAGLIGYAGLLHKRDMDDFATLWEGYRLRSKVADLEDVRKQFPDRHRDVRIRCIGVWDTVGSLGVPGHLDAAFTSFYEFHDTDLGPKVDYAFHALALDEHRKSFVPTLWQQTPEGKAAGQVLEQVWFAGAHSNVGGGYDEHGLSDVALAWMCGKVAEILALDEDGYLAKKRDMRNAWALGRIYDSAEGKWQLLGTVTRRPFDPATRERGCETLHQSVAARLAPGAAAVPEAYRSAALQGIDTTGLVAPLTPLEKRMQWTPGDVRPPSKEARKRSEGILKHVLGIFGGG